MSPETRQNWEVDRPVTTRNSGLGQKWGKKETGVRDVLGPVSATSPRQIQGCAFSLSLNVGCLCFVDFMVKSHTRISMRRGNNLA